MLAIILRKNLTLIVDASSVAANKLTFQRELNSCKLNGKVSDLRDRICRV